MPNRSAHFRISESLGKKPPQGNLAVPVFSHGTMALEFYAPHGHDIQKPHDRDEIYVITAGQGWFNDGENRYAVGPGSFLFVPAGCPHRFEDVTADFSTWVVFYGPDGGESATHRIAEA